MKFKVLWIAGLMLAATVGQAEAGVILSPISVTTDMGNSFSGNIANTINQSFLTNPFVSGVTDFDTYNPSSQSISNIGNSDQWWSASGVTTGVTDFDLGAIYNVSRLAFWNANFLYGMKDFRVLIDDNSAFSSATSMGAFTANFNQSTGQVFVLASASGRYVRFEHLSTYFISSNINEVAFDVTPANAVPEPASLAMWGVGALGAMFARRRRQQMTLGA